MAPLAVAAVPALLLPFTALGGTAIAGATSSPAATTVCAGTLASPGTLAGGTYVAVEVRGACQVNSGNAVVMGNVTIDPNGALVASFAKNAHGSGTSSLTVHGNITGGNGSAAILGCEAQAFSCADDSGNPPTLNSADFVGGSLTMTNPLGVLVHNSTIGGDAVQSGGGGGVSCPFGPPFGPGIFGVFHSPAYSDYEDNTIGGNLWITGLRTCWVGAIRDHVGGSISVLRNTMADPDATEILTNVIGGNIICAGNNPAAQYGDSSGSPNIVSGFGAGECAFSVKSPNPSTPGSPLAPISLPAVQSPGYDLGGADGGLFTFGPPFFGAATGTAEILPYTGLATAPGGRGYWLANGTGLVRNFGPNGRFFGSAAPLILNKPVVGIAAAPGGDGYWEAASDGGVFAFGPAAPFLGSAGGVHLAMPVVGIAATPAGNGYDLVGSDGGVFTYGPGAHFHGSLGNVHLNKPIVGIAVDPATGGYWLVGSDGGVFSFGARFFGSLGNMHLNAPIVGIAAAPTGQGYYLVGADGGVFTFGPGAHFHGSLGGMHLNAAIDGMALG
jgi:hypothetical protein